MSYPILYVDDDEANLTVFEAVCGEEFTVVTASNGVQALACMADRDIAVLLTDQRMPGMTGSELAERVCREYPETVRYLITAYSDLSAAVEAINRGHVQRYLRKPWDAGELRAALREGVELYAMRRRVQDMERRLVEVERVYSLGVIAASIAHELRNPMGVVSGNLELASMALSADTSLGDGAAKLSEYVDGAREGAERMMEIMRGIELSSNRGVGQRAADLREVVNATIKMAGAELRGLARAEVALSDTPRVRGASSQLGQVVLNLLLNAVQAMPEGRGREYNMVSVALAQEGDMVRLDVADNGAGIPEDARARIFDPFFTTKDDGGTGLGLAISRRIVEDSGGRIEVSSSPQGTVFSVYLPIAE